MGRTDKGFLAAAWTADATAASGWMPTTLARYWDPRKPLGAPVSALQDIPLMTEVTASTTASTPASPMASATTTTSYVTALKNSRGPFTPKLQPNGMYLIIWYNNQAMRDPYFLSAGVEALDGQILWSQPEVAVYGTIPPVFRTLSRGP